MPRETIWLIDITEDTPGEFIWTDGAGNVHRIYQVGQDHGGIAVRAGSEEGHRRPPHTEFIEPTPNALSDQFRGIVYQPRIYSFEVLIEDAVRSEFERLEGLWDTWHNPSLGQGVFTRVTAQGFSRALDCVPQTTGDESALWDYGKTFRQAYIAATPFWRTVDMVSVEGRFDGADVVYLEYTNSGEVITYPVVTITGLISQPKIEFVDESQVMEVYMASYSNDDQIIIDCRPNADFRRSARFLRHGTWSGEFLQMTSASRFFELPPGTTTLKIRGLSGNARIEIAAYAYYGGLFSG